MADLVNLTIDGRAVQVPPQTLVIDAAKTVGIAAASPRGQNVRPNMFLAISPIRLISVRVPWPS